MQVGAFFSNLWDEYTRITPQAQRIRDLFTKRGETVINDHVAFRTFAASPVSLDRLEPLILGLGYLRFAPYQFPDKHLHACGYVHDDPIQPRIFLSELDTGKLSPGNQASTQRMIHSIPDSESQDYSVFWSGRLWPLPTFKQYELLLAESEYAAWLSVWGLRANHFTVSVNHLKHTPQIAQVLGLIKETGFKLNTDGGEIKGSPEVLLEQGSTLADRIEFEFADGIKKRIPSCYYEFAKRYPDEHGKIYDGFVPGSAERLFASTNVTG